MPTSEAWARPVATAAAAKPATVPAAASATQRPPVLSAEAIAQTADWVARHQREDGAIPWFHGRRMDPWDHIHSAMGLAAAGRFAEARRAFRFLADTQEADGAWPASSNMEGLIDATHETNHAAYLATGLWHYHLASGDAEFLAEMWPTLERALAFVMGMRAPDGTIHWAVDPSGNVWRAPLITGCASIHGSLICARRIAALLGHERPQWDEVRAGLGVILREREHLFRESSVRERPGRYSMDWYYPVLGGAVRGAAARARLEAERERFLSEGIGCRCVADRAWFTVAESCELVMAFDACGMTEDGRNLLEWVQRLRCKDGGYWMGISYPNQLRWPPERPSWTAATVILAADAIDGASPTSSFFRDLVA